LSTAAGHVQGAFYSKTTFTAIQSTKHYPCRAIFLYFYPSRDVGSIQSIYLWNLYSTSVPLQGNYTRVLPAQARAKIKVLRSLYNELDISRGKERISDGRLFQAERSTIEGPTIVVVHLYAT